MGGYSLLAAPGSRLAGRGACPTLSVASVRACRSHYTVAKTLVVVSGHNDEGW